MKKKTVNLKLLTGTLALTAAIGAFPSHVLAASSGSYTSSVTVAPDEDDDFDGYAMDVNFTTKDGVLTNINLSSEWGRKASKNQTYSTNALIGIVNVIKGSSANLSDIDTVSGATCSSNAIIRAITEAYGASAWSSVSDNLTASVNGTAVSGSVKDDDDDDSGQQPNEKPGDNSENNSNGKPPREDNSLTLPEGTSASHQNLSVKDGVINVQLQLPEGYSPSGINLIRVGNTAIMPARDPESFNRIFSFDADTGILTIAQDQLDGATTLTVSLKFTDGKGNGTTDIIVPILTESSVKLSDKTVSYTGKEIKIDAATVTGSTGAVSYTYYSDEACTDQLDELPVNAGIYYVIASVAEDENYYGASSQPAKLTITPAEDKKETISNDKTSDNKTSDSGVSNNSANNGNNTTASNTNVTTSGTGTSTPKTGDSSPLLPLTGLFGGLLVMIGGYLNYRKRS